MPIIRQIGIDNHNKIHYTINGSGGEIMSGSEVEIRINFMDIINIIHGGVNFNLTFRLMGSLIVDVEVGHKKIGYIISNDPTVGDRIKIGFTSNNDSIKFII